MENTPMICCLIRSFVALVAACAVLTMPLQAPAFAKAPADRGTIAVGKPEELGFSPERLARIHAAVQRHVDARAIAGAVTMVVRHGRIVHLEAHGLIDIESNRPMPKDGIFRLASMTKPVAAVAVMMMIEEGQVRLTDPVSRFIPEFKSLKVAVPKPGFESAAAAAGGRGRGAAPVEIDLVPASREITLGLPFDRFLRQRLFDPLGMKDTGFTLLPDRAARIVTLYGVDRTDWRSFPIRAA
jgi:CubicO group peptidase (beta-lactamase class C family)